MCVHVTGLRLSLSARELYRTHVMMMMMRTMTSVMIHSVPVAPAPRLSSRVLFHVRARRSAPPIHNHLMASAQAGSTQYLLFPGRRHQPLEFGGGGEGGSRENRQYDRRIGALQNRENELWESNNHAAAAAAAQRQTAFVTSVQQQTKHAISEYSNDFRHVFDIRVLDVTDAWRAGYWFSAPALLVITSTYDVMFLPLSVRLSVCMSAK